MSVLLAIVGVLGGGLVCAGVALLFLRWIVGVDHNGREIE